MNIDSHSDESIMNILKMKKVAIIGMSKYEEKAAHFVPKYLLQNGYDITPVNPTTDEILERKCYAEITDVPYAIDIIDVFRPSKDVSDIINGIVKKKPKVMWLQEGIHNIEAENLARSAGIAVVYNRCMLAEHQRLI
ncbi:CoA-binding protein [Candidatus Nitrosopelagicus sp.]|nr:CoA-binding protein [Candidatus Nitrosopelagicus sp.]